MKTLLYFPFQSHCVQNCAYCPALSCLSPEILDDDSARNLLAEAKRNGRKEIILPCNAVGSERTPAIIDLIQSAGLIPIVQVNSRFSLRDIMLFCERLRLKGLRIHFLIDTISEELPSQVAYLTYAFHGLRTTILARRTIDISKILHKLPKRARAGVDVFFPEKQRPNDEFFTNDEIYFLLRELREKFPDLGMRRSLLAETDFFHKPGVESDFRNSLAFADYEKNQTQMGTHSSLRIWITQAFANPLFAPLRWFFMLLAGISWPLIDPERSRVYLYWQFFEVRLFFVRIFWKIYPLYRALVGGIVYALAMIYAALYRCFGIFWYLGGQVWSLAWYVIGPLWEVFGKLWFCLGLFWYGVGLLWYGLGQAWRFTVIAYWQGVALLWSLGGKIWFLCGQIRAAFWVGAGSLWFLGGKIWFCCGQAWRFLVFVYWSLVRVAHFVDRVWTKNFWKLWNRCSPARKTYHFLKRVFWKMWSFAYPLRKIYYFGMYQLRKRVS